MATGLPVRRVCRYRSVGSGLRGQVLASSPFVGAGGTGGTERSPAAWVSRFRNAPSSPGIQLAGGHDPPETRIRGPLDRSHGATPPTRRRAYPSPAISRLLPVLGVSWLDPTQGKILEGRSGDGAAERRWAAYCGEAGVSATLHRLRHTHATELVNDGVSPRHDPQTPRPQAPPDHRALSEQTDHVADQELAVHRVGAGVEDLPQQPQIARAGVPGAPVVLAVDAAGDRADRQGIFRRDEDVPAGCWGWSSAGRRRRRRGRFVNGRPGELRRRVEGG